MNNRNPSHSNNMIHSLVSKFSSLNLHSFKNVTCFNNYVNTSSHFWLNAFKPCSPNNEQNTPLNTDNSIIIHEEKIPKSKFPKKFTISTQQHTNHIQSAYTKEWTKDEIKTLIQQYYTLHNRNWDNISSIITTKSPQQCCYKIKSIELKSNNKHFTKEDDIKLINLAQVYNNDWNKIASCFNGFLPKHLEERYVNKLDPNLKKTKFTQEEDNLIVSNYMKVGNNWQEIAKGFPGRNANMIKNRFYSVLKKKHNLQPVKTMSNVNEGNKESKGVSNSNNNNNVFDISFESDKDSNGDIDKFINDNKQIVMNLSCDDSLSDKLLKIDGVDYSFTMSAINDIESKLKLNEVEGFKMKYEEMFPLEDDFDLFKFNNNITINNNNSTLLSNINSIFETLLDIFQQIAALEQLNNTNNNSSNNSFEMQMQSDIIIDEYTELLMKKEQIVSYRNMLTAKIKSLIDNVNSNNNNTFTNDNVYEINELLLKLINVGKLNIITNINLYKVENNIYKLQPHPDG